MGVSPETRAWVLELFGDLPGVTTRAMMGGLAIYSEGRIFAILGPEDRIYLKADGPLARDLAAEDAEQFAYARGDGRVVRMGYWSLPDAAIDDPETASDWARRALAAQPGGFS